MDALILNGAHAGDRELDTLQDLLQRELATAGWRPESLVLRDIPVAWCQGCFECWVKTPGRCKTNDAGREIAAAVIRSDLVVWLTPVTFGGYSSELKKALDRILGLLSPLFERIQGETHHRKRYDRYPAILAVGVLAPDAEPEEGRIFGELVARNALNFHAPWHSARVLARGAPPQGLIELIRPLLAGSGRAA